MKESSSSPAVVASPEKLPIKSTAVTVDARNFRTKSVVVDMPDEISPNDLHEHPDLWRVVQKSRDKALNALDSVTLCWFDKVIYTHADFANDSEVILFKAPVLTRRERDRTPWRNDTYEVRAIAGAFSYFRSKDGIQMTPRTWPTWQAAMQACIAEQAPARV